MGNGAVSVLLDRGWRSEQTPYLAEVGRRRVHRSAGSGLGLKAKKKIQRRRQVGSAVAARIIVDVTSGSFSALSVAGPPALLARAYG